MRAWLCALLLAAGCSSATSRVRIEIGVADPTTAAASPSLSVYTTRGALFSDRPLSGKLPGDVVVLVNDDVGEVRALVRATDASAAPLEAAGRIAIARGREVVLSLSLSVPLPDGDGDGVPDVIDDCPGLADPTQAGDCALDLGMTDDAVAMDASGDLAPGCGNGAIDPGEICDDGAANSDDPASAASCTSQCKKRAPCGSIAGAGGARVDPATGHCYVMWPTPVAWAAGERDCLARGGHLAAITSKEENDIVKVLSFTAASWIGVVSAPSGSPVVWSNGESGTYRDFMAGEPSAGSASCVVAQTGSTGWADRACSWPAVGQLPVNPINDAAYVCEHTCGNGIVDPGEECDPPSAMGCTAACRLPRPCPQAGGMISPGTGYCYFSTSALVTYAGALTTCPTKTHLATPNSVLENEIARKVITADAWIAVSAQTTPQAFVFDGTGAPTLSLARYHDFLTPDPNQTTAPQCVAMSYMHAGGDGWRDRTCDAATTYLAICERDML